MHNFFLKTLYQKRFSLLWWGVGIAFVTFVTVAVYDSFKATDFDQLLKNLPPALQKIAGNADAFKTVDGYLTQQIYTLRLPLLTIILAISMLVSISAGDEQKGLLETQLSLPVSRTGLLLQKLAAAFVIIFATPFVAATLAITFSLRMLGESFNLVHVLQYNLNCIALALVYGMVAFAFASTTGPRALSLGIASGFAFISYLINSMAPSVTMLETLDKATFFHYYRNDPFSLSNFAVLVTAVLVLIAISIIGFNRRDIRAN